MCQGPPCGWSNTLTQQPSCHIAFHFLLTLFFSHIFKSLQPRAPLVCAVKTLQTWGILYIQTTHAQKTQCLIYSACLTCLCKRK